MFRRNLAPLSPFLIMALLLVFSFISCGGDGGGSSGTPSPSPPVSWRGTQQFGTTGNDVGQGIALDSSSNIYITGSTGGNLDGNTSSGRLDVFLSKFDSSGNKLFTRQFGTTGDDIGYGSAVDKGGNVYVTGSTGGIAGTSVFSDIFLAKFDALGNLLFTRQFGTPFEDIAYGVAVDSTGNVYITGSTGGDLDGNTSSALLDIFLTKFDSTGNRLFTRQLGTTGNDIGYGVAIDSSGNVYVTGSVGGTPGASVFSEIFLAKFDALGNLLYTRQFGTPFEDIAYGVAVDSSANVYITGSTGGDLDGNTSAGRLDVFLTKFDSSGNRLFTQQFGTTGDDIGYGVAVDSSGNVYVTGSIGGNPATSVFSEIFLAKFDPSGNSLFLQQFGTNRDDIGYGIALDSSPNAFITGSTFGDLDGNISSGLLDIFLVKFNSAGVKQ